MPILITYYNTGPNNIRYPNINEVYSEIQIDDIDHSLLYDYSAGWNLSKFLNNLTTQELNYCIQINRIFEVYNLENRDIFDCAFNCIAVSPINSNLFLFKSSCRYNHHFRIDEFYFTLNTVTKQYNFININHEGEWIIVNELYIYDNLRNVIFIINKHDFFVFMEYNNYANNLNINEEKDNYESDSDIEDLDNEEKEDYLNDNESDMMVYFINH